MKRTLHPPIRFSGMVSGGEIFGRYGGLAGRLGLIGASPSMQLMINKEFCRLAACRDAQAAALFADDAAYDGEALWLCLRWSGWLGEAFGIVWMDILCHHISEQVRKAGCRAEPIRALSDALSLPRAAAAAELGNLNPYGLLVHKVFGPRVVLGGLRTDYPFTLQTRWPGGGCDGCGECLRICPQNPESTGGIDLRRCRDCAKCVAACPVGKGEAEQKIIAGLDH